MDEASDVLSVAFAVISVGLAGLLMVGCSNNSDPDPDATADDTAVADTGPSQPDGDSSQDSAGGSDTGDSSADATPTCGSDETAVDDACFQCGPSGGCADTGTTCRPTCDTEDDCPKELAQCSDGVCRRACL